MRATVYLMPISFGFGPASHACAIARALRSRAEILRLVGVGDGIASDFMATTGIFDEVVVEPAPGILPQDLHQPAVAVAICDFDRALAMRQRGLPVVVVDALYWMWEQDPIDPSRVDRYLCLTFPGLEDRLRKRCPLPGRMKVIPQILDGPLPRQARHRSGVVLNFGGGLAPFGGNHTYLAALVESAVEALGEGGDLLVTCSTRAGELLLDRLLPLRVRVAELPFDRMMQTLGERAILLTLPGLSIMWEALQMRIPTVVLPGANYSHHLQVVAYQRFFTNVPIVSWNGFHDYEPLPPGLSEEIGVERAVELGERFARDARARRQLVETLRSILSRGQLEPPTLSLGHPWSSFDGAKHVADEVVGLLASL